MSTLNASILVIKQADTGKKQAEVKAETKGTLMGPFFSATVLQFCSASSGTLYLEDEVTNSPAD